MQYYNGVHYSNQVDDAHEHSGNRHGFKGMLEIVLAQLIADKGSQNGLDHIGDVPDDVIIGIISGKHHHESDGKNGNKKRGVLENLERVILAHGQ
jgi:hypothetical protein